MSRENVLTTNADKNTAYMHSHINQIKPKHAGNSETIKEDKMKMLISMFFIPFILIVSSAAKKFQQKK